MKVTKHVNSKGSSKNTEFLALTVIGMRGDTFISLSFLDLILSANFFLKKFHFFEVKIDINQVNLTPFQALSLIKKYS